jgi:hypothetical protein
MSEDRNRKFDAISENFRKYLMKFVVDGEEYYTIWFTDMSTSDKQDKLLINSSGDILVFFSIGELKDYIRSVLPTLPDSKNFEGWINNYTLDEPDTIYDFAFVRETISGFSRVSDTPKEDALELINVFNLIGDYRYLVNDSYLEEKLDTLVMREFFDSVYNFYFWKTPHGTVDPEIDVTFKDIFNEIITYFIKHFKIS